MLWLAFLYLGTTTSCPLSCLSFPLFWPVLPQPSSWFLSLHVNAAAFSLFRDQDTKVTLYIGNRGHYGVRFSLHDYYDYRIYRNGFIWIYVSVTVKLVKDRQRNLIKKFVFGHSFWHRAVKFSTFSHITTTILCVFHLEFYIINQCKIAANCWKHNNKSSH